MTKMQRNPSTGKRIRNPITGKLQRTIDSLPCDDCDVTPLTISVTLENIINAPDGCSNCIIPVVGAISDRVWTDVPDINGTHTLVQDAILPCKWEKVVAVTYTQDLYLSTNGTCTTFLAQLTWTDWILKVEISGGTAVVIVSGTRSGMPLVLFSSTYSPSSACLEVIDEPLISVAPGQSDNCLPFYDGTPSAIFTVEEL